MDLDSRYMARALELALLGAGNVAPNPLVGAIIVKQGKIIGEGFHKQAGALSVIEMHGNIFETFCFSCGYPNPAPTSSIF